MEVNATTNAASTVAGPAKAGNSRALTSDFETFLKMLTVQMQNQDPLNPIQSSDFAVQLATFSSVEQQVRSNELLQGLGEQMQLSGLSQLAGWVGMEAAVTGPARFDGQPITVVTEVPQGAATASLVIRNGAGQEVERLPISTAGETLQWQGRDAFGQAFLAGDYSFTVESLTAEGLATVTEAATYQLVTEVKTRGGEALVVLQSGHEVGAGTVTGVRQPGA